MSPKAFLRRRLPRLQWLRRRQQPKRHFSFERGREQGEIDAGRLIFVSCQNPECAPQPWKDLACRTIALPQLGAGKSALECVEPAVSITFASLFSDAFNCSLFDEILLPTLDAAHMANVSESVLLLPCLPSLCLSIAHSRDRFLVNFQRRAKVILNEPGPRRNCMPSETQGRTDGRTRTQTLARKSVSALRNGTVA